MSFCITCVARRSPPLFGSSSRTHTLTRTCVHPLPLPPLHLFVAQAGQGGGGEGVRRGSHPPSNNFYFFTRGGGCAGWCCARGWGRRFKEALLNVTMGRKIAICGSLPLHRCSRRLYRWQWVAHTHIWVAEGRGGCKPSRGRGCDLNNPSREHMRYTPNTFPRLLRGAHAPPCHWPWALTGRRRV